MTKQIGLTFFIFVVFATNVYSQTDKDVAAKLERYLTSQFKNSDPGASILVAKKGRIIYQKAFGLANLEHNVPNTPATVFQIGSITKVFTAVAVLQLIEKGKLSLQDSIQKFIPDFSSKGNVITIENLLTHTAGLTEFLNLNHPDSFALRRDFSPMEIIRFFMEEPLEFVPGTKSVYTNSDYFLLGYIIEVASGMSYKTYLEENIFRPCGMMQTYYGDPSLVIPLRARGYVKAQDGFKNAEYISMTIPYSAGALLSTVKDLFKFHQALYEHKLIGPHLLKASTTAFTLNDGSPGNFGYAWFVNFVQVEDHPTILHPGGISGFCSLLMYLPDQDILIVLLSNLRETKLHEISTRLALLSMGKIATKPEVLNKELLKNYTGTYQMKSDLSKVARIHESDEGLVLSVQNTWTGKLSPISKAQFHVNDIKPKATLEFNFDNKGEVIGFSVYQNGRYEWIKIGE